MVTIFLPFSLMVNDIHTLATRNFGKRAEQFNKFS